MYWSDKYKSIYFCLKLLSSVWALAILQLIIARQETTMTMDPSHYTNNKFNQLKMKLIMQLNCNINVMQKKYTIL